MPPDQMSIRVPRVLVGLGGVIAVLGALLIGEPAGAVTAALLVIAAFLAPARFAIVALVATALLAADVIYEYHRGHHGLGSGLGGMAVGALIAVLALLSVVVSSNQPERLP
jgi:hypothetical protein